MIPPAATPSPASFGEYWTDEFVIGCLYKFTKESFPLPDGVYPHSFINPYQYNPSCLPEGWYFVPSTERKDNEMGYWRARGEACEIFKDSVISGWRTTLEFFEGPAPLGRLTNWVMQEYKINQKGANEVQDKRTLCRVFHCDVEGPRAEAQMKKKDVDTVSTIPSVETTSTQDIRGEKALVKNTESPAAERLPGPDAATFLEGSIQNGDYLELDDLSSSDNSSRKSWISDEVFDDLLFKDIEDEIEKDRQKKGSTSNFSVAASARPDHLVLQPAAVESLATAVESKSSTEKTAIKADASTSRQNGASSSNHEASSSSSHKAFLKEKTMPRRGKKKLKIKYLCFMPF